MSDIHPSFSPTFDQSYAYYSKRCAHDRVAKTRKVSVKCVFHADNSPSLSLDLEKGLWKCFACNEGGGIFDFERKMFPSDSVEISWANIYRICGIEAPERKQRWKLLATYDYVDVGGTVLYQKLRYLLPEGKKTFIFRRPNGNGGWIPDLQGVKKVLYRLPELVTTQIAFICEGEKDADNLNTILQPHVEAHPKPRMAATSNFDGGGKWNPAYSPYFTGKLVVIFPDNDAVGKKHGPLVAASVLQYAEKVKVVELPGLNEHGDVSDWIAAGGTVEELLKLVKAAPLWTPEEAEHKLLVEMRDFLETPRREMEWLVDGVIPARVNGLLLADPKAGKSLLTFDLALAMASGSSFLGFPIASRHRVALIAREDSPDQSQKRLGELIAGDGRRGEYNWGQIWLNTKYQSPQFLLDNAEQVEQLIGELKMEQIDLAIFDVFGKLHHQDENDNTAIMSNVISALDHIGVEAGCSILVVHHLGKEEQSNVFKGSRGASAIHGFAEWGLALKIMDASLPRKDWVRRVDFELKYGSPADPVYFKVSGKTDVDVRIDVVDAPEQQQGAPRLVRKKNQDAPPTKSFYEKD